MEDEIEDYLKSAQACVVSAITNCQEQNYDVAAVTCAIASTKLQMKIIKLLNEIKNELKEIKNG